VTDTLSEVVAATLGMTPGEVSDTIGRDTAGAWTSLKHLELVAAAEDAFGVSLTPREIRTISTVGDLRSLLQARKALP
jgi:acyl carrier protein